MATTPAAGEFRCDQCGQCCQTHRVPLTQKDVLRLATEGQSPTDFVELLGPDELNLEGEPETLALLPGGPKMAVLAHGPLGCVFLRRVGANLTCSVHGARPLACRAYPFDRADDPAGRLGLHPAPVCPPSTGMQHAVEAPQARIHLQQVIERDADLYQYAEFIGAWNRAQRMRRRLGKTRRTATAFLLALATPPSKTGGTSPGS